MKNKRNCGMGMPIPGFMPNMMPGVSPMNMSYPMGDMNYYNNNSNSYNSSNDFSSLSSQINSLERRISNLESLVGGNNTTYNTTNYQML